VVVSLVDFRIALRLIDRQILDRNLLMKSSLNSTPLPGMLRTTWTVLTLLCPTSSFAEDKLHEEVAAALEWELPVNECSKPRSIERYSLRSDGDVDFSSFDQYKLKEKQRQKCLENYREALLTDFEFLKGSVKHGLTKQQANQILTKMALIQKTYLSPDGVVE